MASTRLSAKLSEASRFVIRVAQLGCFIHLVNEHVVEVRSCAGPSMYPTLALSGDVLLSIRTSTLRNFISRSPPHVERGDLIDFISPKDPTYSVCKRVIGIEGDVICLDPSKPASKLLRQSSSWGMVSEDSSEWRELGNTASGSVDENQLQLDKPAEETVGPFVKIPPGYLWVVGDNLSNSNDSRDYGPLPLGLVRGKIYARLWPLNRARWLTASSDPLAVQHDLPVPPNNSKGLIDQIPASST